MRVIFNLIYIVALAAMRLRSRLVSRYLMLGVSRTYPDDPRVDRPVHPARGERFLMLGHAPPTRGGGESLTASAPNARLCLPQRSIFCRCVRGYTRDCRLRACARSRAGGRRDHSRYQHFAIVHADHALFPVQFRPESFVECLDIIGMARPTRRPRPSEGTFCSARCFWLAWRHHCLPRS